MGKKVGVVIAVLVGILILCCTGGGYFVKNAFDRIQTTVKDDKEFLKTALTATASKWEEKDFALYADDKFNTPAGKEKTRKLFATLKEKLGPLVELGEIRRSGPMRTVAKTGETPGLYIQFTASAKFEKRSGVFEVTVRNSKEHHVISAISLNPESTLSLSTGDLAGDGGSANNGPGANNEPSQ